MFQYTKQCVQHVLKNRMIFKIWLKSISVSRKSISRTSINKYISSYLFISGVIVDIKKYNKIINGSKNIYDPKIIDYLEDINIIMHPFKAIEYFPRLIYSCCNRTTKHKYFNKIYLQSCKCNDLFLFKRCMKRGVQIGTFYDISNMFENNSINIIKYVIDNINCSNKIYKLLYIRSIKYNKINMIDRINNIYKIKNVRWSKSDVILYISHYIQLKTMKHIIELGANIDINIMLPYSHNLNITKYLVSIGVDIHKDNDFAFQLACELGNVDIAKYLVSIGADIYANDSYGINRLKDDPGFDIEKYANEIKNN